MSANLFNTLIGYAAETGVVFKGSRWLKRLNELDAEMMTKGDCDGLVLSRQQKTMFVQFESQRFFLATGFPDCEISTPALSRIEPTPALFSLAFCELKLVPTGTPDAIRDALQDQHSDIAGYDGHDLETVIDLFPPVVYFEVDSSYNLTSTIARITGSYACRSYVFGPLMLEDRTKDSIRFLFEDASDYLPYSLLLQGLLSFSWPSLFLEMYRCLEHLYAAPQLVGLVDKLSIDSSLRDIAQLLEEELTWRPKEDESLIRLLRHCSRAPIEEVLLSLGREAPSNQVNAVESAARGIYQLRNASVHFRPASTRLDMDEVRWNSLICAMADLLSETYREFAERFYTSRTALKVGS